MNYNKKKNSAIDLHTFEHIVIHESNMVFTK